MQNHKNRSLVSLVLSMCIFSTIGILRKYIDMPSSFIALCRAAVGTVFLGAVVLICRRKVDFHAIKKQLFWLTLSGAALGFNWILLFESYSYTTVTTATLCYYMAPTLVVLSSHFLLKEPMSLKKWVCVFVAFCGMILVSGVVETGIPNLSDIKGILFGLGAAVLYACVVLLNKKISLTSAYDKTIFQLMLAAIVMLPYVLLTENLSGITYAPFSVALLIIAGIVHTGIAYALYFGAIKSLPTQTVALISYIDPTLAIILSALLLKEPMGIYELLGSVLILGAAYVSERKKTDR